MPNCSNCCKAELSDGFLSRLRDYEMLNARIPAMRNQALVGFGFFFLSMCIAWGIGITIVDGDIRLLTYGGLILTGCIAVVTAIRNWRTGFYMFFIWMIF